MEEIEDILNDINQMIETEAESELMATCHTNVLLLQQIFVQAQKWHLDLGKNNIQIIVLRSSNFLNSKKMR